MHTIIFLILLIKIVYSSTVTIPALTTYYFTDPPHKCLEKYITINLQFTTSDNDQITFITYDAAGPTCAYVGTIYENLKLGPYSSYSGTISGVITGNPVCLAFRNNNLVYPATITYQGTYNCDSLPSSSNTYIIWYSVGSILSFIIMILFIRWLCKCHQNQRLTQQTFIRLEPTTIKMENHTQVNLSEKTNTAPPEYNNV